MNLKIFCFGIAAVLVVGWIFCIVANVTYGLTITLAQPAPSPPFPAGSTIDIKGKVALWEAELCPQVAGVACSKKDTTKVFPCDSFNDRVRVMRAFTAMSAIFTPLTAIVFAVLGASPMIPVVSTLPFKMLHIGGMGFAFFNFIICMFSMMFVAVAPHLKSCDKKWLGGAKMSTAFYMTLVGAILALVAAIAAVGTFFFITKANDDSAEANDGSAPRKTAAGEASTKANDPYTVEEGGKNDDASSPQRIKTTQVEEY